MEKTIRRKDRMVTDIRQITDTVDRAKILHLGLLDGEFPYVVPLHYGYQYDSSSDKFTFYMHSAKDGHKLDLIRNNPNVCVQINTDVELASGGDVPCAYGSYFSSVIGQGKAVLVEDAEEKKKALDLLMKNQTGRSFEFNEKMIASVAVIKVEVGEYTCKARIKKPQ